MEETVSSAGFDFPSFLINLTLSGYIISTLGYLLYAITGKKVVHAIALVMLLCGLAFNIASIVQRWFAAGYAPVTNMYESMVLFGACIALAYVIAERVIKIARMGWLVIIFAVLTIAFASFYTDATIKPLIPALNSNWLTVHVISYFSAYAVLTVSFVSSIVYLTKCRGGRVLLRFVLSAILLIYWSWFAYGTTQMMGSGGGGPDYSFFTWLLVISLAASGAIAGLFIWLKPSRLKEPEPPKKAATVTRKSIQFAFPLLTMGLLTGAVWAKEAWGDYWSWDPKETWSLITWLIYLNFLHLRYTVPGIVKSLGWKPERSPLIENIFAFSGFLLNCFTYLGVNYLLSGLHAYA